MDKQGPPPDYPSAPYGGHAPVQYQPQQYQGYGAPQPSVNVVVQQPTAQKIYVEPKNYPLPRQWKSGLCGCFDNVPNCLLTWLCGPCMLCGAANKMNESMCIVCCTPAPLLTMRTKTRMMYGIEGNICGDCMATTFCFACAQCQMQHQLESMVEMN